MKKIIAGIICSAFVVNAGSQVQVLKPLPTPTHINNKPSGKIPPTDPRIQKAAEEKKRIDKILNATVSKITFTAWGADLYNPKRTLVITLEGVNDNKFYWSKNTQGGEIIETINKPKNHSRTWSFSPVDAPGFKNANYKSFLQNGFKARVLKLDSDNGSPFKANFSVTFLFTDGTSVDVAFQGVTIGGSEGVWDLTAKVNGNPVSGNWILPAANKSFPGSVFPDPENPLKVPEIK